MVLHCVAITFNFAHSHSEIPESIASQLSSTSKHSIYTGTLRDCGTLLESKFYVHDRVPFFNHPPSPPPAHCELRSRNILNQ